MAKRRCRLKSCRKYGNAADMLKIPLGYVCNPDCGYRYSQERLHKAAESRRKANKAQARQHKASDRQRQLELTQSVCNKLCLLLDKGKPCISCGRPDGGPKKRNASHFKSRGSNSYLRFDLRNLSASCVVCNLYQSGNIDGYRSGLTERYGSAIVEYLDTAPRVREWSAQELIQMRRDMAEECRRLERGDQPSRDWRKLPDQA